MNLAHDAIIVRVREARFEAFYTTKPHGMGMGLAISRSIIEQHGGRLWAEANPSPDATFSFTVPTRNLHGQSQSRGR